jgi:endonuclease YncB( thermonuclease family)
VLLNAAAPLAPEPITGIPTITDGDTLRIGRERIRLFGIHAPEMHQSCNDDKGARYACGETARNALRRHIADAPVTCEPVDRDQYRRIIARCYSRGEDLNRWMVAHGWAVSYRQFTRDYVPAKERAHAERLGLWRGEFMLPSQWRARQR